MVCFLLSNFILYFLESSYFLCNCNTQLEQCFTVPLSVLVHLYLQSVGRYQSKLHNQKRSTLHSVQWYCRRKLSETRKKCIITDLNAINCFSRYICFNLARTASATVKKIRFSWLTASHTRYRNQNGVRKHSLYILHSVLVQVLPYLNPWEKQLFSVFPYIKGSKLPRTFMRL